MYMTVFSFINIAILVYDMNSGLTLFYFYNCQIHMQGKLTLHLQGHHPPQCINSFNHHNLQREKILQLLAAEEPKGRFASLQVNKRLQKTVWMMVTMPGVS